MNLYEQAVRFCDRCESEYGKGIADEGDHACSTCGDHEAPHVYVPCDDAAVERAACVPLWESFDPGDGNLSTRLRDPADIARDMFRAAGKTR